MVSTVRAGSTHYDVLGLTPVASDEDIAGAFARKMSAFRWHPAGAAAQVWIAYETLRDRIRRADYDRLMGLAPRRQNAWAMAVTLQRSAPFMASPPAPRVSRREGEAAAEPHVAPQPQSREPRRMAEPRSDLEPLIQHIIAVGHAEKARLHRTRARAPDWRKPLLAVGALIVAAGLAGTMAGLSVSNHEAPAEAEPSAPTLQPHAVRQPIAAAPASDPFANPIGPKPERAQRSDIVPAKHGRALLPHRHASARPTHVATEPPDPQTDAGAPPQASADPLAPQPAEASLPLPKSVVARTLDRIGYRCGEVASTAAVAGAPGTYSVTCSSGQTYQAMPVRGRYHFRRAPGG